MMINYRHKISHSIIGYTLIETMISLLLLTTALLGLAQLYNLSLSATHGSIMNDLATLQAESMIERVRANPVAVTTGTYLSLTGEPSGTNCRTSHCSPTDLARFDFREWNEANRLLLPSGSGTITAVSSEQYQITIQWVDGDSSPYYSLLFIPPL
ncbi:MAG: type IV pilus modification protein PilV [Thiotrichales bacterium]|nr:type IV pilus modification protein PilV [Thiotrichales bacterium]